MVQGADGYPTAWGGMKIERVAVRVKRIFATISFACQDSKACVAITLHNPPYMSTTRQVDATLALALHHVHREPAETRFLILRAHVLARLAHRLDHCIEADDVTAVAA